MGYQPLKILQAAHLASQWHTKQRRKGADREPYVNHLIEVAHLVASAGADDDVICAALLHDAIEDQQITATRISREFGANVAALVCELTDNKSLPKAERKAIEIAVAPASAPAPSSSGWPTRSATRGHSG